ncbi:hypothetical protein EVAR_36768_1 [Eumeta japonica]|uniref:Uncharacterized protein n=1 Tax=Eumeta variegata TaxID=151549 RepID=A0A4C1X1Y2_EUMVA|nr:hypothetical protein EVAR_36768_1 [Eumeta japonica]
MKTRFTFQSSHFTYHEDISLLCSRSAEAVQVRLLTGCNVLAARSSPAGEKLCYAISADGNSASAVSVLLSLPLSVTQRSLSDVKRKDQEFAMGRQTREKTTLLLLLASTSASVVRVRAASALQPTTGGRTRTAGKGDRIGRL